MGYFILEASLFVLGLLACAFGWVPLGRRRFIRGSAARIAGAILMIPLPLYLIACKQSDVLPLGRTRESLDPLKPVIEGFVHLAAMTAAFACALAATVFAITASEKRRRED